MPANAGIYLPTANVDLSAILPGARFVDDDRGGTWTVSVAGETIQFTRMHSAAIEGHLAGFCGWIDRLSADAQRKVDAQAAVRLTRTVLGLVCESEFDDNAELWPTLFRIADAYDGYVFVLDSLRLPGGAVIVEEGRVLR